MDLSGFFSPNDTTVCMEDKEEVALKYNAGTIGFWVLL
jgi:hypothetical protein